MTAPAGEPVGLIARELGAEYAGVGLWGTLYRAPGRQRYYRLIPRAELGADQRAQLRQLQDRPRRAAVAPVVPGGRDGDQRAFNGSWYQVVCYESAAQRSLTDALTDPDPARRVAAVVAALRTAPRWWEALGFGLLPMPADIVLTEAGPVLLPLPSWGVPSLTELFDRPERATYLAPALVCGRTEAGRAEDVFALAVTALRCFDAFPEDTSERMLHRAACSAAAAGERSAGRLPAWMQSMEPIREVLDDLRELVGQGAARRASDTAASELADRLSRARDAMDPLAAMRALRSSGEFGQALDLARAVLVDEPGYDVLMLAANIAHKDLLNPLEALSLLDRAVQIDSARAEAYAEQISVIGDFWTAVLGLLTDAIDGSFTRRLDTTVRTAFHRLPPSRRRDHAHAMAGHLIRQGRIEEANAFAHQWLHDGSTLMWWQFDLMLDYALTFLLLGRIKQAEIVAAETKKGLRHVRENRSMDPAKVHEAGLGLAQLEIQLHALRREGGPA
ncbi:hypothetical protein [Streptomyces sp. NPDC059009]|uniref:hypothetical protein n=1 Tax=Streptomyces sp. NPDC059009 TaxID=3346694 RepID=UPI0036B68728